MKKFHIITVGCQMNISDSERIAGYLELHGCKSTPAKEQADFIVLTTCGVKQKAEDKIYSFAHKIKKENPKVKLILTGCLSERVDVKRRLKDKVDVWLPIKDLNKLADYLKLKKKITSFKDYLKFQPKYSSSYSAFVPIGNGCDNFCTYCVVPYARGREVYRSIGEITKEVKNLINSGYIEITLVAQNVNSYKSGKENFSDLLKKINAIKGDFWLRFYSSHPKDMSLELIDTISQLKKVCRHIHLPAQSGDNEILKSMNRKYTIEHYLSLVEKIREKLNSYTSDKWQEPVNITTDIIVGFPGETSKQFNNTSSLLKKVSFDMAYISQFSSRPGTAAEKMKDNVSNEEKKHREEALTKILSQGLLKNNQEYLNQVITVLLESKSRAGEWQGRSRGNKLIKILNSQNEKLKFGDFVDVTITQIKDFGLMGNLIKYEK